jgi:lipid-A-disaccharide synthase
VRTGPRILVLAGEASGDHHAARVVEALSRRLPGARFVGLGGPDLKAAGVELIEGLDRLAVMGFAEVVAHLGFFWKLKRRLTRLLEGGSVDLVLAVDYPGLNLRVAGTARRLGVPVLYYIAPQVWAWKEKRASRLARDAARVAVILPFEEARLRAAGADAHFVGHPLKEIEGPPLDEAEFRHGLDVGERAPLLALLPGSRSQELSAHLDLFRHAAELLQEEWVPEVVPVIAAAPGVDGDRLAATGLRVTPHTRSLLSAARAGLVKSGTSTLEAAVAGCPFVCVYRTSWFTYALAKRLVKVPHIALANLVAGEEVVPEILQDDATPHRLARELRPLFDEGAERRLQVRGLRNVSEALGPPGAAERTAELAIELLEERSSSAGGER